MSARILCALVFASIPALGPVAIAAQDTPPNVLVVLADDFGVDLVQAYGVSPDAPCTPALDGMAAEGLLFRNAWATPVCSPTRAALMTGRYGFRTGIGTVGGGSNVLPLSELTLAEALRDSAPGYTTAAFGKWHLGGNGPGSAQHPLNSGFQQYAGALGGGVQDYLSWTKSVNGVTLPAPVTTYVTLDTTEDALAAVQGLPEPWFVYVAYNAPHTPAHAPPVELCPGGACPNRICGTPAASGPNANRIRAMVEVMDDQFGRLLEAVDADDTFVVFMGDNGTANGALGDPFPAGRGKGSVFQGGVNVPLIVRGPGVAVGESEALVGVTDVFATVGELTGTGLAAEDSVSFAGVLGEPSARPRRTVYAERFEPNGSTLPIAEHDYTARDERFKLVVEPDGSESLFDLEADPFEGVDLLPSVDPAVLAVRHRLTAEIEALQYGASLVGVPSSASLLFGGAQQLVLSLGQSSAGDGHLVLGSSSGTSPGVLIEGLLLPLNPDGYSVATFEGANGPVYQGTLGAVSKQGTAGAALVVPPGLGLALLGTTLHHAALTFDPATGAARSVTAAVALTLGL